MSVDNNGDLSQFSMLDLFRMEADSQTQILTDGLLAMERLKDDASAVESMMRAAHSIKGAAAIVGLEVVVQLAHGMEDAFIAAQNGKLALTPNRVDVLLAGVDLILQLSRLKDSEVEAWLAANGGQIRKTMDAISTIAFLPEPVSLPPSFPRRREPMERLKARKAWIPACAGTTGRRRLLVHRPRPRPHPPPSRPHPPPPHPPPTTPTNAAPRRP
ncbi:Hpt domain-containing protein [Duganella sp. P38]|uniref:Hpt domain-containing protein n=1 Tax=Duganella sp. P38 TaxID=3423949 RepID=UPI003D7A2546